MFTIFTLLDGYGRCCVVYNSRLTTIKILSLAMCYPFLRVWEACCRCEVVSEEQISICNHRKKEMNDATLTDILEKVWGHKKFRENQLAATKSILSGRNTLVILPTGGGKSLCYQLPSIIQEGMAIVVSPLIALMKNQVDFLKSKQIKAEVLNSSLGKPQLQAIKRLIANHEIKLLYIAPETLNKPDIIDLLSKTKISFCAIDEAHCISDWGHDFRPEYRKISETIQQLGKVPIIALTATATSQVQQDIIATLHMEKAQVFASSFNRPNLRYRVLSKSNVHRNLIEHIKSQPSPTGIVYCQSRKKVRAISDFLNCNHIKAAVYHAGLDKKTRIQNQEDFLGNKIDVIVATIAFGMGIDKPNVRFVIHYDAPRSLEAYYQETGRAGRDGKEANCLLFYDEADVTKFEKLSNRQPASKRAKIKRALQGVSYYATSAICRRKQILHYFGERLDKTCQACDNCKEKRVSFDGKALVINLLQAVKKTEGKFDTTYIADLLAGRTPPHIISNHHDKLPCFGKGKKYASSLPAVIYQTLILGYLTACTREHNLVGLTPAGLAFLEKPKEVTLYEEIDYNRPTEAKITHKGKIIDDTLLVQLLELREKQAKKRNLQPYLIFNQGMLEQMATFYPATMEGLSGMLGISPGKAKKFGQPFLVLIQTYVTTYNIVPVAKIAVRSNTNRFMNRIQIIQQIDRKIDLEEMAKANRISYDELLQELENIYDAGICLKLNHYVDQILDKEEQEELYDYLHTMEQDDVEEAIEAYADAFDADQVRLMRLKFLAEVAN